MVAQDGGKPLKFGISSTRDNNDLASLFFIQATDELANRNYGIRRYVLKGALEPLKRPNSSLHDGNCGGDVACLGMRRNRLSNRAVRRLRDLNRPVQGFCGNRNVLEAPGPRRLSVSENFLDSRSGARISLLKDTVPNQSGDIFRGKGNSSPV